MKKYCLTITSLIAFLFFVNGQDINQNDSSIKERMGSGKLKFDTSKTTILPFKKWKERPFDTDLTFFPFDSSYQSGTLTQKDIEDIDSLLILCVADCNNHTHSKEHPWWSHIDLNKHKYWKQIVVAVNSKGEKEVWVNCLCEIPDFEDDNHYWRDRWQTKICIVFDGGSCFFNFKINLSTKKYYSLEVNGTG